MYYRSNRNIFKKWLGNTNLKPYILIMIAVLLVVFVILFFGGNQLVNLLPIETKEMTTESVAQFETTVLQEETTTVKSVEQSISICVNKFDNTVSVYSVEDNKIVDTLKVMPASVNVSLSEGKYMLSDKSIWRMMPDYSYVQYSTKADSEVLFHSPVYELQNRSYLNIDTYKIIGNSNDYVDGITLTVADAKWIFENCDIGTKVEIINDSTKKPLKDVIYPMSIPDDIRWDPTDPAKGNAFIQGKVDFLSGVTDKTIMVGEIIDPWNGIYAKAVDGTNITDYVVIHNYVNNQVPGQYSIEYVIADTSGQVIRQYSNVTVVETVNETQQALGE